MPENKKFELTLEIRNLYTGEEVRKEIVGRDEIEYVLTEAGILDDEIASFIGIQ